MNLTCLLASMDIESLVGATLQTILLSAAVFAVLVLLFSHLRYEDLALNAHHSEKASLTPLDGFRIQAGRFLGTLHKDPPPFCLAVVSLSNGAGLVEQHGAEAANQVYLELERRLRACCRSGDVAILIQPDRIGMAMSITKARAGPMMLRLLAEVSNEVLDLPDRTRIRIQPVAGMAVYPEQGTRIEDLRLTAEALLESRIRDGSGPQVLMPDGPATPESNDTGTSAPAQGPHLDPLTGVLALRELGPALQKMLASYRKDNLPVSFLYLDIDALESYNNHYGRTSGDIILAGLSRLLERHTRSGDLIGRVDGEEFIIAMNCSLVDAGKTALRLASQIKSAHFEFGQNRLRITASIGVAAYPEHGSIARLLYERAEIAVYNAKQRGRGTVSIFDPSMAMPSARKVRRDTAEAY